MYSIIASPHTPLPRSCQSLVGPVFIRPSLELAGADADPGHEPRQGNLGLVAPGADEIDDLIARVVGHPAAYQVSPRLFLARHEQTPGTQRQYPLQKGEKQRWTARIA